MKTLRGSLLVILAIVLAPPAVADDQAIAGLFARAGRDGTMVISSLAEGPTFIYNAPRAQHRFSPASTFKILNSLIALEERAIAGKDDVLKWDGHRYDYPDWNRDQTLASAFRVSCVWCYQELARRIGAPRYRDYLHRSNYGELREPFNLTTFWLDGSLTISALEQIKFLKQVYRRTLPFSAASYDTLRDIMLVETTPTYRIRAKTGWTGRAQPSIGWYVGYVERGDAVWFFATNLDLPDQQDLPLRQGLTREALRLKGIIDGESRE